MHKREAAIGTVQSVFALLFLFSGIYKGLVATPVDLTVLTGTLLALSLLLDWRKAAEIVRHPSAWLFTCLLVYLAIISLPLTGWAPRKLAEAAVFGSLAALAGYVIWHRQEAFIRCAVAAGLLVSSIAFASAVMDGTEGGAISVLSGGYQLPTMLVALALLCATLSEERWRNYVAFPLFIGLLLIGSIPPLFATVVIAPVMLAIAGRWRDARHVAATMSAGLLLVTVAFGPPAFATRILWKMETAQEAVTTPVEDGLPSGAPVMQRLDQNGELTDATSRPYIWKQAIKQWLTAPIFGHGFGNVTYVEGYTTAHNVILEMLAEGGIVAATLLATILLSIAWPLWLSRREAPFVLAVFLLTMSSSMVSGYFIGRVQMFALGMALAASVPASQRFRRHPPLPA